MKCGLLVRDLFKILDLNYLVWVVVGILVVLEKHMIGIYDKNSEYFFLYLRIAKNLAVYGHNHEEY